MDKTEKLIKIVIVTPDGLCYEHHGQIAIFDAIDGEIGIMAGHLPIVIPMAIGEVQVKRGEHIDEKEDKIAINGGYLEFNNDVATVITDAAERSYNIDLKRAESAKERAERLLEEAKHGNQDVSIDRAEVALKRAINRIKVHNED